MKKKLLIYTSAIAIAAIAVFYQNLFGPHFFQSIVYAEEALFIERSQTFSKLLFQLEEDKIIRSAKWTRKLAILTGNDKKLKPGVYRFNNKMSALQVLLKIKSGKRETVRLTLREGWDHFDIAAYLRIAGVIDREEDWHNFFNSREHRKIFREVITSELPVFKKHPFANAEGFIYPETYIVPKGLVIPALTKASYRHFIKECRELFVNLSPERASEVFRAASLVEKESSVPEERPIIASVLYNRLDKNMKLRYDPSILYALKASGREKSSVYGNNINIRKQHFTWAHPYNTYTQKGLPPGPICSPSFSSLMSTMNPDQTEYLFFVAKGDGSGEHFFSKTYAEHEMNIKKYLANRRQ